MCGLQREYVYFAKGSWKFTRQQVMNTIWDKRGVKLKGTMPDMIRYFLILSLNRSTWMRARDKSLLLIHSSFVNCFLPSLNGGISRVAPFSARRSCMVKPRSARTTSPGSILSKNPDFLVICLSEILPSKQSLTNIKAPQGATPIKTLLVE